MKERKVVTLDSAEELKPWLKALADAGYWHSRCYFHHNAEPPGFTRFLYKYRSLVTAEGGGGPSGPYTATSIDRLRDLIVRSEFRLSRPREFNDPFDLKTRVTLVGANPIGRKAFYKWAKTNEGMQKFFKAVLHGPVDEEAPRAGFQKLIDTWRDSTGVFCFAGNPRSILMWSHYASNHNGICLQFEVARDIDTLIQAIPVQYGVDYPTVDFLLEMDSGLRKTLTSKHEGWAYENEHRIVAPGQGGDFFRVRPQALRSIIIGCRATKETISVVHSLLSERRKIGQQDVAVFKVEEHQKAYRLIIRRHY